MSSLDTEGPYPTQSTAVGFRCYIVCSLTNTARVVGACPSGKLAPHRKSTLCPRRHFARLPAGMSKRTLDEFFDDDDDDFLLPEDYTHCR